MHGVHSACDIHTQRRGSGECQTGFATRSAVKAIHCHHHREERHEVGGSKDHSGRLPSETAVAREGSTPRRGRSRGREGSLFRIRIGSGGVH